MSGESVTTGDDVNVYENVVVGATPNPVMTDPDDIDEDFARAANEILQDAVEVLRRLVPSHQAAVAIVVDGDFASMRKVFSLSPKYAPWAGYRVPAKGAGIHAWVIEQRRPVRLTEAELEAHPAWIGFGPERDRHPPMRGWLAVPLLDAAGRCWGLVQLSDRVTGDYTQADEDAAVRLAHLVSVGLEGLWALRDARKEARARQT